MTDQKPITVTSRIQSLDMVSFSVEKIDSDQQIDKSKITLEIGTTVAINVDKKLIALNCPVQIFSTAAKDQLLGVIEVKGEFIIENFEEVSSAGGVPIPVLATFAGVVISAARGMLRIVSKGTVLESAIIPIINPSQVFQNIRP